MDKQAYREESDRFESALGTAGRRKRMVARLRATRAALIRCGRCIRRRALLSASAGIDLLNNTLKTPFLSPLECECVSDPARSHFGTLSRFSLTDETALSQFRALSRFSDR